MKSTTNQKRDGIIAALAEFPPEALIDETALGRIFARCPKTIRRAVARGELPRPVRLFGKSTWTARAVLDHLAARLDTAQREAEKLNRRISQLSA
jgi:hypothetical protein